MIRVYFALTLLEILDKHVNFASRKSLFLLVIKIKESSYLKYGSGSVKIVYYSYDVLLIKGA